MKRRLPAIAGAVLCAALAAACSSSTSSGHNSAPRNGLPHGSGTVHVLYAGSLLNLMERDIGPSFHAATGYSFQGEGAGSTQLANEIEGKVKQADVFVSAAPKANNTLEGAANGDWVGWYASFATTALVIGYNPHSSYAKDFASEPWYQVISKPGIRLGRTDPKLDPKGALTVTALARAASTEHDSALATSVERSAQVFPEEDLLGRLEAGQLDAGFFYTIEATEAHLPTVPLTGASEHATFTVAVLNHAPDEQGAVAFVDYLLSDQGRARLRQHGLTLISPATLSGPASSVPAELRPALTSASSTSS